MCSMTIDPLNRFRKSDVTLDATIAFTGAVSRAISVTATTQTTASMRNPSARATNASKWQVFQKFRVPTAIPYVLGGMKIAITFAIIGAVIGEFVGGSEGLGYLIIIANSELDTPLAFAALLVLSAGGILMYIAVEACERFLTPWNAVAQEKNLSVSP